MSRPLRTSAYTLCAVAATVLIRYGLDPWLGDQLPLAAGFWAVAFAVWLGGWRAGLAATLLAYFICAFLFIEPRYHFTFGLKSNQFAIIAYLPTSTAVILFGEAMWRARRRSETAEAAARGQAETLNAIFCSIADAIITTDASGRVAYLNPVAENLTGCSSAQAVGKPLEQVIAGIGRSPGGGRRRIEDRASEIRDDAGHITGRVHLFRDVTQYHEAERALRESEERWQLAVNSTHDGIWDWNVSTGALYWSPRCKEMLGYTDDELQMSVENVRELIHPDDRDRAWEGAARHLEGKSDQYADEYRLRHKDGSYRWVLARGLALRDASGRPVRFAGSHTDVTQRRRLDEESRRHRELIEAVINLLPVSVAIIGGSDLRFRLANPAYLTMVQGRPVEGCTVQEVWPEAQPFFGDRCRHVIETGQMYHSIDEVFAITDPQTGKQELRSFNWLMHRIMLPGDNEAGVMVTVWETSEQKRAETALRESEHRLRLAQNAANVGTWEFDLLSGKVYWSEGLWNLLGLEVGDQEPTYERWCSHLHPDDRDSILSCFEASMHSNKREFDFEFRIVRADGEVRWVTSKGQIVCDAGGRPLKAVGANQDITERKRTEQALRDSEQQVRLLTDALPVLIAYVDADLRYRFNNLAYREWFGVSPDAINGRHLRDVLGEVVFQQRLPHIQQALRGEAVVFEGATTHRQRGAVACEVHYVPDIGANGKARGFVVLVQDVTVRKHAEVERERLLASERAARAEAERASEAKSDFLATLSHELRTPLTPVLLTVSMMESHPGLPPDLREDIATIRRNVELESRLIGDLLDLTRISKGKLQLEFQDVSLHPIIRSAIEICQREASAQLVLELSAARHTVRGDRTRLQQIFWNLVNNAQKFTPPGGTITVRTSDLPDDRVRIEVRDTGVGIDPAVLPKLFNAFEQGDVRVQRQQAGLGLGLAISRKLAEAHGGAIFACSAGRGQGASFVVDLPVIEVTEPAQPPVLPPTAPINLDKTLQVLLIEDHEPTLRVMTRLLSSLGHRVTGVTSVATATAAARSGNFDVIISDLGLPDGSGLDLMREVRAMYEGRAIALTGYGMESDVAASRAAGFAEHLTKPVDIEKLSAAINRVNCG
jgi:PAS domain S-box-containing protein